MQDMTIQVPDTTAIAAETSPIVAEAAALVVADQAGHARALDVAKRAAKGKAAIEEMLEPAVKAANAAHKTLTGLRNNLTAPLDHARQIASTKAMNWESEQRRKAEEDRKRLEAEARRLEEERQIADAIAAEEEGDAETAEAIMAEPTITPVVHVAPAIAKVQGVATKTTWDAEVTDLRALIRYVAEHPEWEHLLMPSAVALRGLARSQKGALSIPGVRAVESKDYAFRSN